MENPRKLEQINQISRSLPTEPTNYAKFTKSTPITSKLGVNPENSRNVQRMTQVLRLLHNAPANNAKFVTFSFLTNFFAHVSLHIFCIYAHILHHCRLVLALTNFTVKTVFYIKYKCISPNICHFRTNCTH